MNIFVYVGSYNGKKSNTLEIANMYIKELEKICIKESINADIYTAKNINILECTGCNSCFVEGKCPLENKDDMLILKEKMEKADIIIWGSPSYAHNVSSHMKKLIDRISGWFHYLNLGGKLAIPISTNSMTGNGYVIDYLTRMFVHMGAYVVGKIEGIDKKIVGKKVQVDENSIKLSIFKDVVVQRCIVHLIRNSIKYIPFKEFIAEAMRTDLKFNILEEELQY